MGKYSRWCCMSPVQRTGTCIMMFLAWLIQLHLKKCGFLVDPMRV